MKILQIIQRRQLRGAEVFACQLAVELQQLGHEVHVAYLFETHDELIFPIHFICIGASQKRRLWDMQGYRTLANLIRDGQYDLVQANAGDTLKYAVLSRYMEKSRARLVFRNANVLGRFLKGALHRVYVRWLLKRCDYIISVSENCRQDLLAISSEFSLKSETITIGTYNFSSVPAIHRDKDNGPVFMNVASFVKEKNHKFLISIFQQYFERGGKGTLWLVGSGPLQKDTEILAESVGLKERVVFWGTRANVIELLKSADIFILPSLIEGLPGVILESLSCGIPVVCSRVGGTSEIIENGVNGVCIEEYNIDSYVSALNRLNDDKVYTEQIVHAGRKVVAEHYLMPDIAQRFELRYKSLIN